MTVYFGSSEDIDFNLLNGTTVNTNASNFDSAYCRNSFFTHEGATPRSIELVLSSPITTLYVTVRVKMDDTQKSASDSAVITVREGSTGVARIKALNGTWYIQTYNGGWVDRATFSVAPVDGAMGRITFHVVLHASSGVITAWVNDTQAATWTGDTVGDTGAAGLDEIKFQGARPDGLGDAYWSEFVVADEQTINMRVATLVPNADGANTAWTNDYTAVDEITNSVGDTLISPTAAQVETMGLSNYGGSTDVAIKGVFVSSSATRDGSGPQSLQHVIRVSTSEYVSSTIAVSTVYATYRKGWATNPYTAADWTIADIDALESGVKSIA